MEPPHGHKAHATIIKITCVGILGIFLVAGLSPFHAPRNDVTWLANEDGLRFGHHGSILTSGAFPADSNGTADGSLELWLQPNRGRSNHTILSFDDSPHPGVPFSLRQYGDALVVQQHNEDSHGVSRTAWLVVNGVFRDKKPVFLTITLGPRTTSVYLNGILAKVFTILGDSNNNLTGQLVIANSPYVSDSWAGQILGLAIYHAQLTAAIVREHFDTWSRNHRPVLAQGETPVALYLFNERVGSTIHNQFDRNTDLTIPQRYFVLHPAFLELPWRGFQNNRGYWEDFAVNVVGFIPFGFFGMAYLSSVRMTRRAAGITVLAGFLISLTIETLQAFLPTRDSGMNDLITNTLGTALGVMFYRCSWSQAMLTKAMDFAASLLNA